MRLLQLLLRMILGSYIANQTGRACAAVLPSNCGKQQIRFGRIVGGEDTYDGEFPWMVSILLYGSHFCGGTLIAPSWVITAAHCVQRYLPVYFRARFGEYRFSTDEESHRPVERHIDQIVIHPNFSIPVRYFNDVALLKLASPVAYDNYIWPICLPPENKTVDYDGQEMTVAGWGWLAEQKEGGKRSDVLLKVSVPVVNTKVCQSWYTEAGKNVHLIPQLQMCAGFKKGQKDSCQGDSGGPLMQKGENEQYTLAGVVSAGIGCARPLLPGLYTKVQPFLPWIEDVIQSD